MKNYMLASKYFYFLIICLLIWCIIIIPSFFNFFSYSIPLTDNILNDSFEVDMYKNINQNNFWLIWGQQDYEYRFIKNSYIDTSNMQLLLANSEWRSSDFYVDQNREYSILNIEKVIPDKQKLRQILSDYENFMEDDSYFYLFDYPSFPQILWLGIKKSDFSDLKIVWLFTIHSIDWVIWYDNGFLIIPPYKFPVDKDSFSFITTEKLENWSFFTNWWKQYSNYLWSDNQRIYYRTTNPDLYVLARIEKKSDFKILNIEEIKPVYLNDNFWIEILSKQTEKHWKLLLEWVWEYPEIYCDNWHIYAFWLHWNWSFPIDESTVSREEKEMFDEDGLSTYYTLSDKNYYYQLIHHVEWWIFELKRIAK